jgi:hypothetical protein
LLIRVNSKLTGKGERQKKLCPDFYESNILKDYSPAACPSIEGTNDVVMAARFPPASLVVGRRGRAGMMAPYAMMGRLLGGDRKGGMGMTAHVLHGETGQQEAHKKDLDSKRG